MTTNDNEDEASPSLETEWAETVPTGEASSTERHSSPSVRSAASSCPQGPSASPALPPAATVAAARNTSPATPLRSTPLSSPTRIPLRVPRHQRFLPTAAVALQQLAAPEELREPRLRQDRQLSAVNDSRCAYWASVGTIPCSRSTRTCRSYSPCQKSPFS